MLSLSHSADLFISDTTEQGYVKYRGIGQIFFAFLFICCRIQCDLKMKDENQNRVCVSLFTIETTVWLAGSELCHASTTCFPTFFPTLNL